ncbi:hypothetical protein NPIL_454541 [Nephila pilipes]|uniref:Uncharacterized protein n=1 Tax=Nephila pilipes TaxID=299642 RepID=A0A8X6PEF1_NEPPI|nr:hypothetical protein NPIL_454541 [Nephila pilipes]
MSFQSFPLKLSKGIMVIVNIRDRKWADTCNGIYNLITPFNAFLFDFLTDLQLSVQKIVTLGSAIGPRLDSFYKYIEFSSSLRGLNDYQTPYHADLRETICESWTLSN